jgi:hypothetical protein
MSAQDLLIEANNIVSTYYDTLESRETRFEGKQQQEVVALCKRIAVLRNNDNPDAACANMCKKLAMSRR